MGLVRRPIGHTFTVKELLDVRGITEGTLIRPHDARDVFLFKVARALLRPCFYPLPIQS